MMGVKIIYPLRFAMSHAEPVTARLRTAIAACLMMAIAALPVAAADVFEVRDVDVDVTAETAAAAREQALAEGEVRAFRQLLERLTLVQDYPRLPEYTKNETAGYVKDFAVANEKTSPVRYLAKLNFRFKHEAIRRLLMDLGLEFAETPSRPVVVLAVYQDAGAVVLWDEPNPWRAAWRQLGDGGGLVPIVLPLGDLQDIAAIGAEQAISGDPSRLRAVARRYDTQTTITTYAVVKFDAQTARRNIVVSVNRVGRSGGGGEPEILSFRQNEGEDIAALLVRAAKGTEQHIQDVWKQQNLLTFDSLGVVAVTVPIASLKDWLDVQRKLKGVSLIRRAEMVLMSLEEVRVNLHYAGGAAQLKTALGQSDLILLEEEGEWVLYPAGLQPPNRS